jgi:hypothetical protein
MVDRIGKIADSISKVQNIKADVNQLHPFLNFALHRPGYNLVIDI